MNTTTTTLRCRAQRSAAADRFNKTQCPNRAATTARIDSSVEYAVCNRHANALDVALYVGPGWRRAF